MDVAFRRIARGQTMTDKIKISNLYKVFGKNPTASTLPKQHAEIGKLSSYDSCSALEYWWSRNDFDTASNGPSTGAVATFFEDELLRQQSRYFSSWVEEKSSDLDAEQKRAVYRIVTALSDYRIVLVGWNFHSEETNPIHNWTLERYIMSKTDLLPNVVLC